MSSIELVLAIPEKLRPRGSVLASIVAAACMSCMGCNKAETGTAKPALSTNPRAPSSTGADAVRGHRRPGSGDKGDR